MHIKVKGGTARSDGAPLCVECRWAKVLRGDRGQEHTECGQLDAQVTFKVVSCSEFVSRQHPTLWHMEDIAWILRTDNRKRQVGFVRGRDLDHRARLALDEDSWRAGTGKSTLLEALAECCGFNPEGGSRDHQRAVFAERSRLAQSLRLSWSRKVVEGFFVRAESFYNFASYLDEVSDMRAYGGRSLHEQSHGESFLALFNNRFEQGLYLLDEPEAALSPQRQLSLLRILHDLEAPGHAQFLIATHSPILLSYPGAVVYTLDRGGFEEVDYRDTRHFQVTRDFLNGPERFYKHLFAPQDSEGDP